MPFGPNQINVGYGQSTNNPSGISNEVVPVNPAQTPANFVITGGSIDGTPIGVTTPSTGSFTSIKDSAATASTLAYFNTNKALASATVGSGLTFAGGVLSAASAGTVTSVSVVSANGMAGTVATATTTPAITLSTSITGILKGNGTAISAASAGTDYLTPTGSGASLTGITATQVGLGSVTNNAQTKASIVPNTIPSAGQLFVGNAGGTAYAPATISGSGATATLSSSGVLTLSSIANASLSNSAITIAGTSTSLGGSIAQDTITGLASTGIIKRTAANTLAIATAGTDYQSAITFGTAVQTALGVNVGTAGSIVVNGGALGTPSGGTVTNLSGTASININGTVGATTPNTGAFTTLNLSGLETISLATAASATDGVLVKTSATASSGNQKWSPAVSWEGQGWKTQATAASQPVKWRAYVQPTAGFSNPTSEWLLQSSVNGGGYTTQLVISGDSGGYVTASSLLQGAVVQSSGFGTGGFILYNANGSDMTMLQSNGASGPWTLNFDNADSGNRQLSFGGDLTLTGANKFPTIQVGNAAGYKSSDGSTGYTGTITTASLVGKTVTIKDGIITNIA